MAIDLNYFYSLCSDSSSSTTCAADTSLSRDYKTSGLSPDCVGDSQLNTDCQRSCGNCTYPEGGPGTPCDGFACTSPVYAAAGLSANGICYTPSSDEESLIGSDSFCLSPYPNSDCGSISSDTCDDASVTSSCTEFCSDNFQCSSGYCNSATGQCC